MKFFSHKPEDNDLYPLDQQVNSPEEKISIRRSHLKDPSAIVFVLLFVMFGGYFLIKSFAAALPVASLYAAQMNLPAGATTYNSSTFQGEKYLKMTANGTVTGSINLPGIVTSLAVTASGDRCSGAPDMNIGLDGGNVLTNYAVNSSGWTTKTINLRQSLAAGTHTLNLSFTNAYKNRNCQRNLYLYITNFYGPNTTTTPAPTITFTATPTIINSGSYSTLTWGSTNASSCLASGAWNGTEPVSGESVTADLSQTSTYTLDCSGAGGTTNTSVTVTVNPTTTGSNQEALGFAVFNTESASNGTPSSAFAEYANSVGKLPNFAEWFTTWPNSGAGSGASSSSSPLYWESQVSQIEEDRLTPVISWGSNDVSLNSIVSGSEDSSVLAPAAALAKAYPGTMYIRFDWEMNGAWSAYSPVNSAQPAGETPATFVAAWRHVVNYFRSAGVTNVKWVWAPNVDGGLGTSGCAASGSKATCMAAYYPGDSYVDYAGLDGYNYAYAQGSSNPWLTPSQVFGASYAELEGITKKPVIISEVSSVEANRNEVAQGLSKAEWIQQLSSYLPTLGNVAAICWFNQPATVGSSVADFGVDTSAASLAAWNQYFVNNAQYQGKLP